MIDGGAPTIVHVGQTTAEGVRLVSVEGDAVVVELDGKRRSVRMASMSFPRRAVTGRRKRNWLPMLVVTSRPWGPSTVAVPASWSIPVQRWCRWEPIEAARIGIDWRKGQPGVVQTANGLVRAWRVTLDSVRVGDVTINGVDGLVQNPSCRSCCSA